MFGCITILKEFNNSIDTSGNNFKKQVLKSKFNESNLKLK
jgi:hypothetical protein